MSTNNSMIEILSGERRTPGAAIVRAVATCAEPIYRLAVNLRNHKFDTGKRTIHRAHAPVVSIGNLTAGGTGKTPMVIYTVERLLAHQRTPAIVLRGYKADEHGQSDEAELMQSVLPDVPIITNPDRVAAAKHIEANHPDVDVIVLDDAFQHRRIARNFDVVLIDATNPFGYDHVLPRGLMREPPENLARADAVIITRSDQVSPATLDEIDRRITHHRQHPPIARCVHRWNQTLDQNDAHAPIELTQVFAFCGLGNPGAFFSQVNQRMQMMGAHAFADHHDYTTDDITDLASQADRRGAKALITTEKDWVKLQRVLESHPASMPILRAQTAIEFTQGHDAFEQRLLAAIAPSPNDHERPD